MKTIHVAFPPKFSRIRSFTADGVKYINDNFKYEKTSSPHADQSKGLNASDTTASGCHGHCTTAAAGKQ